MEKKKRGAPYGNKNAVGHGAPIGNRNAEKHGFYATFIYPTKFNECVFKLLELNNIKPTRANFFKGRDELLKIIRDRG